MHNKFNKSIDFFQNRFKEDIYSYFELESKYHVHMAIHLFREEMFEKYGVIPLGEFTTLYKTSPKEALEVLVLDYIPDGIYNLIIKKMSIKSLGAEDVYKRFAKNTNLNILRVI